MVPDPMRAYAKYLANKLASYARRQGMPRDQVISLQAWVMARLAQNGHRLLRTRTSSTATWTLALRLLDEFRDLPEVLPVPPAMEDTIELCVRVRCLDVEVGRATFDRAAGLAHTTFVPSDEYSMVASFARDVGKWLAVRHYWRPMDGDVTDVIAEQWRGERLSLEDDLGRELSVHHVIIAERKHPPYSAPRIQLIADFRPDHARVAAVVPTGDIGSRGRS